MSVLGFFQFFYFSRIFPPENGSILGRNVLVLYWVFLAVLFPVSPFFFHVVIVMGCCKNVSMIELHQVVNLCTLYLHLKFKSVDFAQNVGKLRNYPGIPETFLGHYVNQMGSSKVRSCSRSRHDYDDRHSHHIHSRIEERPLHREFYQHLVSRVVIVPINRPCFHGPSWDFSQVRITGMRLMVSFPVAQNNQISSSAL